MILATNIRNIRKFQGLSQAGLAKKAGLCCQAIVNIENGATQEPLFSTVKAVADALGVSTDILHAETLEMTYDIRKAG